ncbi:FAD/NAD(P)-binding protein [Novosphingobium resinovorum]|uniref:FAD/NAD(P)-binding protein n=1 Tax=Novosphingobium resinovorum TaxID=158500 RepID=UPI0009F5290D|nr:FAD/NAD(P)-binding protein [Novosphingobium resinovorum]
MNQDEAQMQDAEVSTPIKGAAMRRMIIVGGGFSAATLAVQVLRTTDVPVAITVIEPREVIGAGLAYSTMDPDHRLNGPLEGHMIDPACPDELLQWCLAERILDRDPDCLGPAGHAFLRRGDLGSFFSYTVSKQAREAKCGSTLRHVRDVAISVTCANEIYQVETKEHGVLTAELLVIATGNPEPSLRAPFPASAHLHPAIVANPLEPRRLLDVADNARALVVGSGLTALDVVSTLLRERPQCDITVISRRGLRPSAHAPDIVERPSEDAAAAKPKVPNTDAPVPTFLADEVPSIRRWCRALRTEISRVQEAGGSWHDPFDAVRDTVWKLWPQLPIDEQQRFLKKLRVYYDVHRFRAPVMNDKMVRKAEAKGRVRFLAATLLNVDAPAKSLNVTADMQVGADKTRLRRDYDLVINCTGLDARSALSDNPVLVSLVEQGMLSVHENGLGFDVTANCEGVGSDGTIQKNPAGDRAPVCRHIRRPGGSYVHRSASSAHCAGLERHNHLARSGKSLRR